VTVDTPFLSLFCFVNFSLFGLPSGGVRAQWAQARYYPTPRVCPDPQLPPRHPVLVFSLSSHALLLIGGGAEGAGRHLPPPLYAGGGEARGAKTFASFCLSITVRRAGPGASLSSSPELLTGGRRRAFSSHGFLSRGGRDGM